MEIKVMPVFNTSCPDIKHKLNEWFQKTSFLTIERNFKKGGMLLAQRIERSNLKRRDCSFFAFILR
jgi:hypothetical protein